jgi:hypothetical protein
MLRESQRNLSELRHQFFNFSANQLLAKPFNRLTNQLVPQAECEHDTGAEDIIVVEQGGSKCVLGSGVKASLPTPCSTGKPMSRVCSGAIRCCVMSPSAGQSPRLPKQPSPVFKGIEYSRAPFGECKV